MAYAERLFFERPFRYQHPPPRRAVGLRVRKHQTVSEGDRKRLMPVRPQIEADFKREQGLDLAHKKQLASVLSLIKQFKTLLLTSHDLDFVSSLSDELVFINNAKIVNISKSLSKEQFLKVYETIYGEEQGNENYLL